MSPKTASNVWKLTLGYFFDELIFFIPIFVPFLTDFGFSMQQIFILEAAFAAMLFIFEIPSGYFADRYGRKNSLIIGSGLSVSGVILFAFSNSYADFLLGEIIVGIGSSFISGAREALLYDSLAENGGEALYKKEQGHAMFIGRVASIISNVLGAIMATQFLRLPFYATIPPFVLWFLLNLTLVEPTRHKEEAEHWNCFKRIFRESVIENQKLRYYVIFAAIPPAFFLMSFWLDQRYMQFINFPIFYFGFVIAAMNIGSGLASKYAHRIESKINPRALRAFIPLLAILSYICLAFIKSPWALALFVIPSTLWGFSLPVFNDVIQKMTTADRRATLLSIRSFITRCLFLVLGPLLGWVVDLYSVQHAFLAAALLLFVLSSTSLLMLRFVKML